MSDFRSQPMTATHSPTPWELVEATEHHGPYICNVYGGDVCDLYAMSNPSMPSTASGGTSRPISFVDADANAAFIVEAVNSHASLKARIQALEGALQTAQELLTIIVNPKDHPNPSILHLRAQCVELERKTRALLQPKDGAK
jgi:hypothetical protein